MNKKIYIAILTIITVVCIIFGSCYHILGWGAKLFGKMHSPSENYFLSGSAGEQVYDDVPKLDRFDSITVNAQIMDLTIQTGSDYGYSFSGNQKLAPICTVKNGLLTLTQNTDLKKGRFGKNRCSVIVTIPADHDLNTIDITTNVGDIDIDEVNADTLTLLADVGDIDLEDGSYGILSLGANIGDIEVEKCHFLTLSITSNVGNVKVHSASDLSEYQLDLSTNIGEVHINGQKYGRRYTQNETKDRSASITNNTGDISLSY